jgi:hypothetical protein
MLTRENTQQQQQQQLGGNEANQAGPAWDSSTNPHTIKSGKDNITTKTCNFILIKINKYRLCYFLIVKVLKQTLGNSILKLA